MPKNDAELLKKVGEILAAGIGGIEAKKPHNEARLSALIASIIDGETLADALETWTERDPDDRHDPATDMPAVAAWLADYLAQELDQKGVRAKSVILLLPSEDGQDYAHAVLYPASWSRDEADMRAIEAFTAGQAKNPHEWSWDDFEPELIARGFTIPCWTAGPTWDRSR